MPEIIERMAQNRVSHALCVSVCLPDLPRVLKLAQDWPNIYASVGVHPDYPDTPEPTVAGLLELAIQPKVVAIGETGLDYYRSDPDADMEWQRERFRVHIRASRQSGKPLIIHTRAAAADTLRIMREEGAGTKDGGAGGVMHCFTESLETAQAALEMGFYISFSGIVTFRNARELQEVARAVPLESMLIETDSPYLAPVPHRGKVNEPAYVAHVGKFLAELKGVPEEQLAQRTSANFLELFDISGDIPR